MLKKKFFLLLSLLSSPAFSMSDFALAKAKEFLSTNSTLFPNQNYLVIIDYSLPSSAKRFHLYNIKTKQTESFLTAHGKGSDPEHLGIAKKFGDIEGSKMSSLGFFKTLDTYHGQHGYSLKLEGLSDTNKNALKRLIVIHGANYVDPQRRIIGRSWGCPALENKFTQEVIDKIKNGALIYATNGIKN